MERTSKRILESIIRMDIMPCSHCALTKECEVFQNTSAAERAQYRKEDVVRSYGYTALCLKLRWFRFLKEQIKGVDYEIQVE